MDHSRALPPRWKRCPPISNGFIADTFIPIKVPLDNSYNHLLLPDMYFTPERLISYLEEKKHTVGLWIDLTNTTRYYDRRVVKDRNIRYQKINCRGHGECPSEEQVDQFIRIVQEFREKNDEQYVIVHCTHGFNRTGFVICAYLYKVENWDIEAAIKLFAKERTPGIYKQEYIDELIRRYGDDPSLSISAPPKPDWCREDEIYADDDDEVRSAGHNNHAGGSGSMYEISADQFIGVEGVEQVNDAQLVKRYQSMCTAYCQFRPGQFPGAQPVSLSHKNIQLLAQEKYMVSWKADGSRYLLLIINEDEMLFFDRDYRVYKLSGVKFLQRHTFEPLSNTLLDGEFVIDKHQGRDYPRYLIYDILYCNNVDVSKENFEKRLNIIFKEVIFPREEAKRQGKIDRTLETIGIRQKDFINVGNCHKYFTKKFAQSLAHPIDGLIFQPVNLGYEPGRCDKMLKWKPPSHNSVDFILKVVPETRAGRLESHIGQLWVNGYPNPFGQIKVTKELRSLNDKVIECRFDLKTSEWILMRERKDKSHPNALRTARAVLESIQNPITREILLDFISNQRYRE